MMETCIPIKDIRSGMKNINLVFIVLENLSSTRTKENREVFSFKVSDPTGSINCSIWDEPGKLLAPGDIVKLTKGYASIWRNCLTLYSGKSGEIIKMGDFCMVFNESLNMSEPIPVAQQNQTNHINSTNGNGRQNNSSLPNATSTTTKSSTEAPSKNYARKSVKEPRQRYSINKK